MTGVLMFLNNYRMIRVLMVQNTVVSG